MTKSPIKLPAPVYNDDKHHIRLYQGDCLELLSLIPESTFDLIFADPPYFLSNGGITCHAGRSRAASRSGSVRLHRMRKTLFFQEAGASSPRASRTK